MKQSLCRLLVASVVGIMAGCCNAQRAPVAQPAPAPYPRPVTTIGPAPAAPGAYQPGPAPYPSVPPGVTAPPPGQAVTPFPMVPPPPQAINPYPAPPPGVPSTSGAVFPPSNGIARVENRWVPADNGIRLGAPETSAGVGPQAPPRLYPPEKTAEPPINYSPTRLPVGIPQFATALDNVTTGLRPSLDDGLDWLQARGYRTVVQVRAPADNDDADRKQVEKRGMKYLAIEVSPPTLTKASVEELDRIVRDTSGQPVFIYDRDGSLAGGLWYLYFRTVAQCPDDVARVRAGALGLREDRDGPHRDMWLAIQKLLSEEKKE